MVFRRKKNKHDTVPKIPMKAASAFMKRNEYEQQRQQEEQQDQYQIRQDEFLQQQQQQHEEPSLSSSRRRRTLDDLKSPTKAQLLQNYALGNTNIEPPDDNEETGEMENGSTIQQQVQQSLQHAASLARQKQQTDEALNIYQSIKDRLQPLKELWASEQGADVSFIMGKLSERKGDSTLATIYYKEAFRLYSEMRKRMDDKKTISNTKINGEVPAVYTDDVLQQKRFKADLKTVLVLETMGQIASKRQDYELSSELYGAAHAFMNKGMERFESEEHIKQWTAVKVRLKKDTQYVSSKLKEQRQKKGNDNNKNNDGTATKNRGRTIQPSDTTDDASKTLNSLMSSSNGGYTWRGSRRGSEEGSSSTFGTSTYNTATSTYYTAAEDANRASASSDEYDDGSTVLTKKLADLEFMNQPIQYAMTGINLLPSFLSNVMDAVGDSHCFHVTSSRCIRLSTEEDTSTAAATDMTYPSSTVESSMAEDPDGVAVTSKTKPETTKTSATPVSNKNSNNRFALELIRTISTGNNSSSTMNLKDNLLSPSSFEKTKTTSSFSPYSTFHGIKRRQESNVTSNSQKSNQFEMNDVSEMMKAVKTGETNIKHIKQTLSPTTTTSPEEKSPDISSSSRTMNKDLLAGALDEIMNDNQQGSKK